MKLILLTTPRFFVEEDKIITDLFEEGLDMLHLRKPGEEPIYAERLLKLIPKQYNKHIITHQHFYLKEEFQLMGIHLSKYNPEPPEGYKGHICETIHSIDELGEAKKKVDSVILSPIFDSISRPNYKSEFDFETLKKASKAGLIDKNTIALGGISIDKIKMLKDLGFGGVMISGDLWSRFNIYSTTDYQELIKYFREIRKAVG
ncbi:MAG: thiamine phosphate synthase [Bacteroidaceae bacterium]|nr:thiamine phosphate synthase [Bacteroidaceae bacterium]